MNILKWFKKWLGCLPEDSHNYVLEYNEDGELIMTRKYPTDGTEDET